jgi:hypothetical protein
VSYDSSAEPGSRSPLPVVKKGCYVFPSPDVFGWHDTEDLGQLPSEAIDSSIRTPWIKPKFGSHFLPVVEADVA